MLNCPKNQFEKELNTYLLEGQELINRHQFFNITLSNLATLERDYKFWDQEVEEFLKSRFSPTNGNEYSRAFKNANQYNFNVITKSLNNQNINLSTTKLEIFKENCQNKIDILISLKRKLKFMQGIELSDFSNQNIDPNKNKIMSKIFISHSSLDTKYVEKIIDILEIIGVPSKQIFCSSFEGYNIKVGANFLEQLKIELNNEVLVIFVLSKNFYSSPVCLCEMGASWIKTREHFPILIPPFGYQDIKGVIPTTHGMKINEKEKYNNFKDVIQNFIGLNPIDHSVWERKRDNILKEINNIQTVSATIPSIQNNHTTIPQTEDIYYENCNNIIKHNSEIEWPDDFDMQLHYIQQQQKAVKDLINYSPLDIDKEKFQMIRIKARKEWPNDFEMQLHYEQTQVESLRKLNTL